MKDLVGASSSFVAQRSLETGDDLDQANLEEVAQSSANRAQYLKAVTDDMLATGIKTPVGIKIAGPDLAELERVASEVEAVVKGVPGTLSAFNYRSCRLLAN